METWVGLLVLGLTGHALGQDVALCGSLSRDLAQCLMGAEAGAKKDSQQEAAEAAVLECSQWKDAQGAFAVGAACRDAVAAINERILCMDRGFANSSFQEAMLDCIGNATQDAMVQSNKRRHEPHLFQPQQAGQAFPQGGAAMGARGGQGGRQGPHPPSEMDACMRDRAFQTCMRSDVAKKHFERGFRNARRQPQPGSQGGHPCEREQRQLAEAGCPQQPLPDSLCPCKCALMEGLKEECGFPPSALTCPQICQRAAAHHAAMSSGQRGQQPQQPPFMG